MSNSDLNKLTYADLKAEEERLSERLALVQNATRSMERLFPEKKENIKQEQLFKPIEVTGLKDSFVGMSTHDATVLLSEEKGKPLQTKEILQGFRNRGKIITAKEPMTSLYNGLDGAVKRQNSKLIKLGGGFWGIKGRDENWKSS